MTTLLVKNMTCGSCARHITQAVKALDPDAQLTIDIPARKVSIDSTQPVGDLVKAIEAVDYEVAVASE
ncbi:heavy-metal-associated domain-containing protein [Cellvibrio japonicus]|jgi:copper chaperone|uniref:Periplasmic metal-binding protein-related protein n=1 Tax=Cellvibrio japonicus (strain Ueda107) TaxID=498211 RepID=B3PFX0_CELJU|nr:heavy-metal-associated domain-containing protein [Cellvibrio japonicus]ACE82727.1 periplasmic metal-binding protein-related protein [Cellvibrio japonicus Ueda107]QEI12335.1 heavy-metal-associated domain-containing protein [Cellvibrio japonicus]QEI15908.1 heavy-metal-associated domain-containing protein [Cellvibrio japonicus]QEI19487.1 heavy-metal-associated domain-containing protein [Cellvibrio japonicus]